MRGPVITAEQVADIRRLLADGHSMRTVAAMLNISRSSVKKYKTEEAVERTRQICRAFEKRRAVKLRAQPGAKPTGRNAIRTASPILRELFTEVWRQQLNQAELGKKIGVSHRAVTSWKHGTAEPSLLSIEALASVLGYEIVLRKRDV